MLTHPVYRASPCVADARLQVRAFLVRETIPVTPPKPRLLDRVRAACALGTTVGARRRPTLRG
jgi:hypothetical protein